MAENSCPDKAERLKTGHRQAFPIFVAMLTDDEDKIYQLLRQQCQRICPDGQVIYLLRKSILAVCDIVALTRAFFDTGIEPEYCAIILVSLIRKGFVKQIENGDCSLSFVPLGYWDYRETVTSYKPIDFGR